MHENTPISVSKSRGAILKSASTLLICVLIAGTVLSLTSCRSKSSNTNPGGRSLSPHEVSFAEIAMYASREEVENLVRPLSWGRDGSLAIWRPGKKNRDMEGIDEVRISFRGGRVKRIEVRYAQIFDVQYRGVNRMVRERYGPAGSEGALDSVQSVWRYDSLTVTLTPNRKQHWTGSFYVFTPTINLEETLPEHNPSEENNE